MSVPDSLVPGAMSWALTYAIHSTVLLGLAALITRAPGGGDAWREVVWKGALLGAVLTATLATALPVRPLGGRIDVPLAAASAPLPAAGSAGEAAPVIGPTPEAVINTTADATTGPAPGAAGARQPDRRLDPATDPQSDPGSRAGGFAWASTLMLLWAAAAAALLGALVFVNLRLFHALKDRTRLTEGPLPALLAELRRRAGVWRPVALSVSDACPTPLVVGAWEICIPPRFLTELDEAQQRAALAHELAHLRRRDPLWQLGAAALNAVLFFQPLNVLARRRMREASEHLCDDWAIRLTGTPLALGECLTAVASWTTARPLVTLRATHAIAEGGSPLIHRIRRIAGGAGGRLERRLPAVAGVSLLVLATALVAPAAGSRPTSAPESEAASDGQAPAGSAATVAEGDTTDTVRLLERLAMDDPDPRVRQEAAAQLSDFPHPAAARALMRIVRRAEDPDVRSEAAQQLDEFPTDAVVAVLLEVVFEDPAPAVRFEAIDTLGGLLDDFALSSARDALARLALEHPDPAVRLEAMAARAGDGG